MSFQKAKRRLIIFNLPFDLKLYSRSEKGLDSLVQTVRVFSDDIGMEFGIEKCAMLVMEKGKIVKSVGIELSDGAGFGIKKTRACDNRTPRHKF